MILATIGSVFISFAIVQISIPFYVIGGVIWFFTFIFFIVTFVAIVRFIAEYFANKLNALTWKVDLSGLEIKPKEEE